MQQDFAIFVNEQLHTLRIPATSLRVIGQCANLTHGADSIKLSVIGGKIYTPDGRSWAYYMKGNPHPKMHDEELTVAQLLEMRAERKKNRPKFDAVTEK